MVIKKDLNANTNNNNIIISYLLSDSCKSSNV